MCAAGAPRGTIMWTFVRDLLGAELELLIGRERGRVCSISSRVPNARAPLGQTVAHIGLRPVEVRS